MGRIIAISVLAIIALLVVYTAVKWFMQDADGKQRFASIVFVGLLGGVLLGLLPHLWLLSVVCGSALALIVAYAAFKEFDTWLADFNRSESERRRKK